MLIKPEVNEVLTHELLLRDPHFGKQILHISEIGPYRPEVQMRVIYGHIAKNIDGIYGAIWGGNNGISCFLGWCTGIGSWCFNPINIEDHVWSRVNNAFIPKAYSSIKEIRLLSSKNYYYNQDSEDVITKLFIAGICGKDEVLWEK